jgi:hypothetical protein
MSKIIRNIDFLFPILVGFLFAWQAFEKKQYDAIFIIFFVALTFANTRRKFTHGSDEYKQECEKIIERRREDAKKRRWYDGYGVSWGSIISGSTLITVIIVTLGFFLFKKFSANDYLVSFFIAGLITFFLRVLRYLSRDFVWDSLFGIIIVSIFMLCSKMLGGL